MTGYRVSSELLLMKMKRRGGGGSKMTKIFLTTGTRLNILPVDQSLRTVSVSGNSFPKLTNVFQIEYLLVTLKSSP